MSFLRCSRVWRETGEGLEMELSSEHPRFFGHMAARGWGETPTRTSPRVQENLIHSKEQKILNYHSCGKKMDVAQSYCICCIISTMKQARRP